MKETLTHKLDVGRLDLGGHEAEMVWHFLYLHSKSASRCQAGNALEIIDCIRMGLPMEGIAAFLDKTNVSRNQLSHILHISTRQLSRYVTTDRLSPEQSNFLYELARIYTKTVDVLGDQPAAEHWLNRKQIALGERSPLDILDTAEGVRLVDDLLAQIEYGFYS
jgi:putative toxin-antitoxin system antitoxin component (TIGR02293 family)